MLKLTDEQKSILKNAIDRARQLDQLPSALDAIYQEFQIELDRRKPKCDASGRCCRFESYGHRLFVSTIELAVFSSGGMGVLPMYFRQTTGETPVPPTPVPPTPVLPSWIHTQNGDGTGCPFQVDGLCSVHGIRPFGCRIFFCDPTSIDWQTSNYERFHKKIKELHESLGIEYLYVEWREGLSALGFSSSKGNRLHVLSG